VWCPPSSLVELIPKVSIKPSIYANSNKQYVCIHTQGFGDISGSNTGEKAMCIFLMLWGVLLFGSLLADLAEINHAGLVPSLSLSLSQRER